VNFHATGAIMQSVELRHLRYFMAAAEEEHFGRASDRLHVTRPAVSQSIADVEAELRTPLFERLAHRVKLTAAGRALLPKVQALMKDLDAALTVAKQVGQGNSRTLKIEYGSPTAMHSLFPDSNPSSNALEEGGVVTLRMLLNGDSFPAASLARTR